MFGFLFGEILYFQICNIRMLLKQSKRHFIAFTYSCPPHFLSSYCAVYFIHPSVIWKRKALFLSKSI